jgi:hypothetical protein
MSSFNSYEQTELNMMRGLFDRLSPAPRAYTSGWERSWGLRPRLYAFVRSAHSAALHVNQALADEAGNLPGRYRSRY